MQGTNWVQFFSRIPVNLHDCLALTMSTGAEIVLQRIVKLDEDFAVVRGRMAGTQDGGRVVVIPYNMMVSVAFNRRMMDKEVYAIFGPPGQMAAAMEFSPADDPDAARKPTEEPETEAPTVSAPAAPVNPPAPAPPPLAMPSKTILLAKLRARLAENHGQIGK
jgi:hypothetical protein